ncbi:MAG: spondin domain-containing protein [Methylococcales bacterium]|nr:spondin domain-containing protein [Methylococcales bacterium]
MLTNKIKKPLLFVLGLLISQTSIGGVATYRLTVTNNWTPEKHTINYPAEAHFSWLGGGTHDATQSFWALGELSPSTAFQNMAETGVTTDFVTEIKAASGTPLEWKHWFCQPTQTHTNCGSLVVYFTIDSRQPLVTLTSMLGPSPDWFVGVSGLHLQNNKNEWISRIDVPLALYDAGTEEGVKTTMKNPESSPHKPISLISYDKSSGDYLPSEEEYIVGSYTFELIHDSNIQSKTKDCLFNWAEQQYPELFKPASEKSELYEDYTYRYYKDSNTYLGFFQDKTVHSLTPKKSNEIVDYGDIQQYLQLAGCDNK